jgi:hypothetical protein
MGKKLPPVTREQIGDVMIQQNIRMAPAKKSFLPVHRAGSRWPLGGQGRAEPVRRFIRKPD